METNTKANPTFIILLMLACVLSVGFAFYKYIIQESFTYFISEEEVPDQFDFSTYGL